jgi:hypothetical protein
VEAREAAAAHTTGVQGGEDGLACPQHRDDNARAQQVPASACIFVSARVRMCVHVFVHES